MSDEKVVETVYGSHHKFEIVKKEGGIFSDAKFYVRKDGKAYRGAFATLRDAVKAAQDES